MFPANLLPNLSIAAFLQLWWVCLARTVKSHCILKSTLPLCTSVGSGWSSFSGPGRKFFVFSVSDWGGGVFHNFLSLSAESTFQAHDKVSSSRQKSSSSCICVYLKVTQTNALLVWDLHLILKSSYNFVLFLLHSDITGVCVSKRLIWEEKPRLKIGIYWI